LLFKVFTGEGAQGLPNIGSITTTSVFWERQS